MPAAVRALAGIMLGDASRDAVLQRACTATKVVIPGADDVPVSEGHTDRRKSARTVRLGVVFRPWHVLKLLAREPGDLLSIRGACAAGSCREGEEP